jgi:hypothetical protein
MNPSKHSAGEYVIIFSIGLPGRFAQWCDAAIGRIANRLGGPVIVKAWPSLDDMLGYEGISSALEEAALTLIGTDATHLVIGARHADERLLATLAETDARFVLALDDPRMAVADILAETGAEFCAVTRAVANSCPLLTRFSSLPGALTIVGQGGDSDAAAAVSAMARHLRIIINESEAADIVDELAATGLTHSGTASRDWSSCIAEPGKSMVEGALTAYARSFAGGAVDRIIWTRDLFIVASDPSKRPNDVLDVSHVSGGDRFLIYGPYIRVPPGLWSARVILGVSEETLGHTFVIDAYAGKPLARASLQSNGSGVYAPEITFSLDPSTDHGLEIRVLVGSNGAKGQLALGNVVLSRMVIAGVDDTANSEEDFRTVLKL